MELFHGLCKLWYIYTYISIYNLIVNHESTDFKTQFINSFIKWCNQRVVKMGPKFRVDTFNSITHRSLFSFLTSKTKETKSFEYVESRNNVVIVFALLYLQFLALVLFMMTFVNCCIFVDFHTVFVPLTPNLFLLGMETYRLLKIRRFPAEF